MTATTWKPGPNGTRVAMIDGAVHIHPADDHNAHHAGCPAPYAERIARGRAIMADYPGPADGIVGDDDTRDPIHTSADTIGEPPCIAGACYPNDDGTACAYCGLPAEPVDPQEAAEALYAAFLDTIERERAQEARAGRYIQTVGPLYGAKSGRALNLDTPSDRERRYDRMDSAYHRATRASRDFALHSLIRLVWPIMAAASAQQQTGAEQ